MFSQKTSFYVFLLFKPIIYPPHALSNDFYKLLKKNFEKVEKSYFWKKILQYKEQYFKKLSVHFLLTSATHFIRNILACIKNTLYVILAFLKNGGQILYKFVQNLTAVINIYLLFFKATLRKRVPTTNECNIIVLNIFTSKNKLRKGVRTANECNE